MNKAEMIEAVRQGSGLDLSSKATGEIVDTVFDTISGAIKQDGRFSLAGFGTWTVRARAARMGRNPQTGATIRRDQTRRALFPCRVRNLDRARARGPHGAESPDWRDHRDQGEQDRGFQSRAQFEGRFIGNSTGGHPSSRRFRRSC